MRKLNGYELSVLPVYGTPKIKQSPEGYSLLPHNTKYSVKIANRNSNRCNATLIIDGKDMGTWRLDAGECAVIDRPSNNDGIFTFYKLGTSESKKVRLETNDYAGLVQVVFIPEKKRRNTWIDEINEVSRDGCKSFSMDTETVTRGGPGGQSLSAGGSGLSGKSNQVFGEEFIDYEGETTLSMRLVCLDMSDNEPRPLTNSTSIPPSLITPKLSKREFREYCESQLEGFSKETILNSLKQLEDLGRLDVSNLTMNDFKKVHAHIYEGW